MRHAVGYRKLRRDPGHRKALLRNLMNALVRSERIETTVAKAKELRRLADRIITLGKRDTLHARRRVFALLSDKKNAEKVFAGLASRFASRAGGYTRIVRTGYRSGDGAEVAIIEYLPESEKPAGASKGKEKKKAAARSRKPAAGKPSPRKAPAKAEKEGSVAAAPKPKRTRKAPAAPKGKES